jgi:hypothetical protein
VALPATPLGAEHAAHRASAGHGHASSAPGYERHRPEASVLYRVVEQHWPAFRERAEAAGGLPRFLEREVQELLRCGRLEFGCLRLACDDCGFERLVAFSCKRRGFCPSCLGRRMNDLACHLVQRVIPQVPTRQWVCSLPFRLRYLCGYDRELCAEVLGAFVGELRRSLAWRAKRLLGLASVAQAQTGTITFVQRSDSGLRLNVHFHVLALDGVYVRDAETGTPVFHVLPAPSEDEVARVARRTAERVEQILVRHGRSLDPEADAGDDPLADQPALAGLAAASTRGVDLVGERAGRPSLRLLDPDRARPAEPVALVMGFNVHAARAIAARDRLGLEQLCRYLARPPLAQQRLELLADGRVRYTMKKPWKDGTLALVFEPEDLIARLCSMVPPPRWHLVRFHGVLSAHAALRPLIVPQPAPASGATGAMAGSCGAEAGVQLELFGSVAAIAAALGAVPSRDDGASREPARKPWAWLLRHVFAEDLQTCERCGGRMRWRQVATTPDAIARLLARHEPGSGPGPPRRARPSRLRLPEQLELAFGK